jgi:hypothetical protein
MSKESFIKGAKNLIEKIALRIMQKFLVRYSAAIAKHFSHRDAEFAKFKGEVIRVATDHHARLRKLEGAVQ